MHISSKGFTLVELAIALVVIGIVISLGVTLIGPMTKRIKFSESRDIVNAAVESVSSYAATNNKLPRLDNSVPVDEFTPSVRNPNDAFARPLIYLYDSNLAPASSTKDSVCGRKTTNITVNSGANNIPNVAFIILSSGDDYTVDTKIGGIAVSSGPITSTTTVAIDTDNDIVKWTTLDELRTKIGCQGAQLKIINNEMPFGSVTTGVYSATIYADGGVPFTSGGNYKWCVKGSLPSPIANPTPGCTATPDCSTLGSEAATEWLQSTNLTIATAAGSPLTTPNTYSFTVLVRDNNDNNTATSNDNCSSKTFVITVNP